MTLCLNCGIAVPTGTKRYTNEAKIPTTEITVGQYFELSADSTTGDKRSRPYVCGSCMYKLRKAIVVPVQKLPKSKVVLQQRNRMAKRKASDEENFTKWMKLEDKAASEPQDSMESKSRRVRKKSAKLIEMEEYEVFEKKMLKSGHKSATVTNNTKTPPKKNKTKVTGPSSGSGMTLDNLALVAASELHDIKPKESAAPSEQTGHNEPTAWETVSETEVAPASSQPASQTTIVPTISPVSSPPKLKVSPLKLKNLGFSLSVPPSATNQMDTTPKIVKPLKQPKPKQSFEDQLMSPDAVVTQSKPKVKKPKKPKPPKEKPPDIMESPHLQSQNANITIKQDNSELKMKLCLNTAKPNVSDIVLKSDEEQPAIWPSQIRDDRDGRVLVKLKKKKLKKNKFDGEKQISEDISNSIENGELSTWTGPSTSSVNGGDCLSTQEGQLEIDLDRKQHTKSHKKRDEKLSERKHDRKISERQLDGVQSDRKRDRKSLKKKKLKKLKNESGSASDPLINVLKREVKFEPEDDVTFEEDETGVRPVNMYSNTEAMAMKLKTSKEKKASGGAPKSKEKRFRRRGPTAYTMFSNNYRMKVLTENPGIDFASISKRLGEIWQCLPAKEKMMWKRKAKQRVNKILKFNNGTTTDPLNDMVFTSKVPSAFRKTSLALHSRKHADMKPLRKLVAQKQPVKVAAKVKSVVDEEASATLLGQLLTSHIPENSTPQSDGVLVHKADDTVPCLPIDIAAHLKLLGDSLQTIGFRLQDHRGPIAVQGSLSVLLDSAICAMGSLVCLTNQLPEMKTISNKTHSKNLDNIAYIMPGIG